MSAKPDGGPAFPVNPDFPVVDTAAGGLRRTEFGMSLRDWFAGQACGGFVLAHCIANGPTMSEAEIAEHAFSLADALLAERAKP